MHNLLNSKYNAMLSTPKTSKTCQELALANFLLTKITNVMLLYIVVGHRPHFVPPITSLIRPR